MNEPSTCPFCGAKHDRTTSTRGNDVVPADGDLMLCFDCGEWIFYVDDGNDGRFRKPTDLEYDEIATDPECRQLNEAWDWVRKGASP